MQTQFYKSLSKYFLIALMFLCFNILISLPAQADETTSSTPGNTETTTSTESIIQIETNTTTIEIVTTTIETSTTTIEVPTTTVDIPTTTIKIVTTTIEISTTTADIPTSTSDIITPSSTTSTEFTTATNPTGSTGSNNNTVVQQPNILITQSQISEAANKILNYLKSQQTPDGKIIDGTITDWSIISFGAHGQYAEEIKNATTSLLDYEKKYNLDDPSDLNSCATYPRHILALLAAGVDKNDSAILGLKEKMNTVCYQNNLYGLNGINDDVFALIALLSIGEDINQPIIQTTISTTKSWQMDTGAFSWPDWFNQDNKVAGDDITGAAINALKYAQNQGASVDASIFTKAKSYLKSTQQADGGWGWGTSDIMTTSWVLMGINALGETQNDWFTASSTNPWYPLVNQLKPDGYYESAWVPGTADWFALKHVVPALLGKNWPVILPTKVTNFSTGATFTYSTGGGSPTPVIVPTTTIIIATTTVATTTVPTTTLDITTSTMDTEKEQITISNEQITAATSENKNYTPQQTNKTGKTIQQYNNRTIEQTPTLFESKKTDNTKTNDQIIDALPIDTGTRNTAKKVLALSGSSTIAVGLYLGWKLLRGVV